jgi:protein-S-isoprenylcysteine O-methyltransferase Ste14
MTLALRIPPPVVLLACGALAYALALAVPGASLVAPPAQPNAGDTAGAMVVVGTTAMATIAAIALAVAGGLLALLAFIEFQKARTTVNPFSPKNTTALVTGGVFGWSRNPIYLGDLLILLGWAIYLQHALAFLLLPVFVVYINRFQIEPEEQVLREKFGERFDAYRQRVRRWL